MLNCLQLFLAVSLHLGLENDYNNIHPHARCTVDNHISGIYYNSENNISLYTGFEYNGFELGLVTGYSSNDILPMIRYKKNNWFISPAYETDGNYGITIGLEIGR
jgi:hypothetical protein